MVFVSNPIPKDQIEEVRLYLITNLEKKITIKNLSTHFGISRKRIREGFIFYYKEPPYSYLHQARMFYSLYKLLYTGDTIKHISLSTAYQDERNFITAFHNYFGITPGYVRSLGDLKENKK